MSEKICKVRNWSMGNFILTFEEIEKGKKFELKPNGTIAIDSDELNYLTNECPNAFKMGYLEIIDLDKSKGVDAPITENKMDEKEMESILSGNFNTMKSKINKIETSHILKELRIKAEEMGKNTKVLDLIDERIEQVADSLVL